MDTAIERRISLIHALVGAGLGVGSPGMFGTTITLATALLVGFVFSFPLYIITRNTFNLPPEEYSLKHWLTKGYVYFMAAWLLTWTLSYNLAG